MPHKTSHDIARELLALPPKPIILMGYEGGTIIEKIFPHDYYDAWSFDDLLAESPPYEMVRHDKRHPSDPRAPHNQSPRA